MKNTQHIEGLETFKESMSVLMHPGGDPKRNLYVDVEQTENYYEPSQDISVVRILNGVVALGEMCFKSNGDLLDRIYLNERLTDPETGEYPKTKERVLQLKVAIKDAVQIEELKLQDLLEVLPKRPDIL